MAAYSPYDLFRVLCERVGWPQEEEKRVALASIAEWERMQMFGNLASLTACPHPPELIRDGRCEDCGHQVTSGGYGSTGRYYGPNSGYYGR